MVIKLTEVRTGKPAYINSEYIGLIRPARSENGEITVVELVGFYLLFNIAGLQELLSKILITVLVIILNFFISKFFAFKK